jgi:hypothetical protein
MNCHSQKDVQIYEDEDSVRKKDLVMIRLVYVDSDSARVENWREIYKRNVDTSLLPKEKI